MEAPAMDADKPTIRINPAQEAFDRNEAAYAAKMARKVAASDAPNGTQPRDKLDGAPAWSWFATSR
jgi:hypothetical protein